MELCNVNWPNSSCFQSGVAIPRKHPFKHIFRWYAFTRAINTTGLNSSLFSFPLLLPSPLPSPPLHLFYLLHAHSSPPFTSSPLPFSPYLLSVSFPLPLSFFLPLIIYLPKFFSELKHELKTELLCLFVINTSL